MSNLDERLEQASAEVRRHMQRVSLPPIREQRMQRRRTVAAVALGVVAIAGIATPLVLLNQSWLSGTAVLGSIPASEPDVILWLSPQAGDEEVQRAASYAMTWEGVSYAAPFGRDRTLEEFREEFAAQPALVLMVEGDPSILRASVRLWLEEAADAEAIAEEASLRLAESGTVVAQITVLDDMPEETTGTTVPDGTGLSTTTVPALSDDQANRLRVRAMLRAWETFEVHAPMCMSAEASPGLRAEVVRTFPQDAEYFDDIENIRDGAGTGYRCTVVSPSEVKAIYGDGSGLVGVDVWVITGDLAGSARTYLFVFDGSKWLDTTPEESGVTVTSAVS
jgi:hypothetical protein